MNVKIKPLRKAPYGSRRVQQIIKRVEAKDLNIIVEYYIENLKQHTEAAKYLFHLQRLPPTLILSQRAGRFVLPPMPQSYANQT